MIIKVCGMADAGNARQVAELSPDFMGFIFYRPSPRNAFGLDAQEIRALPRGIKKVGVFVDEDDGFIVETVERYGLDYVQLHGDETPHFCRNLRGKGLRIIKAFGISSAQDLQPVGQYEGLCYLYIFDAKTPLKGGSGTKFDHSLLGAYTGETPFLLSGGIGPEEDINLRKIHPRCTGVDINSRFETAPGMKNISLLADFITKTRKQNNHEQD